MKKKHGKMKDIFASDGAEIKKNRKEDTKGNENAVQKGGRGGRGKRRGMKGEESTA